MGYEIAAGLGGKLARPPRHVFFLGGGGAYLMMGQGNATPGQEGGSPNIFRLDHPRVSWNGRRGATLWEGGVRRPAPASAGRRTESGELDGNCMAVDFVANAASMGAEAVKADTRSQIEAALTQARSREGVQVVVIPVDGSQHVGGYESWWDVPVAEVSPLESV